MTSDPNTRALSILRIGVGVLFLFFGEYKVFGSQFTLGGGFEGWINRVYGRRRRLSVLRRAIRRVLVRAQEGQR